MDRKIGQKGITLLEIIVVLAILVIMASFVIPALGRWKRKYDIENTIKEIYAALNEARMKAFNEKRVCGLTWSGNAVSIIHLRCDTDGDGEVVDVSDNGTKEYWNRTLNLVLNENFDSNYCRFNYKGLALDLGSVDHRTFYYSGTDPGAEYSCVTVSFTRIKMGKWDGEDCQVR